MERKVFTIGTTTFDIFFKNDQPVESRIGGSSLNTSVSIARLGIPVNFITELGNDKIGDLSYQFISKNHINTSGITRFKSLSKVALAFLDHYNNAEYAFYNATGKSSSWNIPEIKKSDIFSFGSSFAVKESNREILKMILKEAKSKGAIVIYDPNFRTSNAQQYPHLRKYIDENLQEADIVKGSNEDFNNIFGLSSSKAVWDLLKPYQVSSLIYTANQGNVNIHQNNDTQHFEVPSIQTLSTVGAGDNFTAGLIYGLIKNNITSDMLGKIQLEQWKEIAGYGVRFAQKVCMSYNNYLSQEYANNFLLTG